MFADRKEFRAVAAALLAAQRALAFYPPGHPHIKATVDECFRVLHLVLEREHQIPIVLAGNEFVAGDLQVPLAGESLVEFAGLLRRAGIERLIFAEGLRSWEIQAFLGALNLDEDAIAEAGGGAAVLAQESVQHIFASALGFGSAGDAADAMLVRAWETYSGGLRVVRRLRHGYRESGKLEHLEETKGFVRDIVELGMRQTRPLLALQQLKLHDEYSFTHSIDVATLTLVIAQGLGLGKHDLYEVTLAAILHDIGKERVPVEVLRKPGKLNDEEWKEMADHSLVGAKILATTPGVGDLAPIVAYEHHLKQTGRGAGSAKWRLHVVSEMVTIADVYDALRSSRPYRGELACDRAMEIMYDEAPEKFNPDLFAGFARLVGYYPPGMCVRLATGETAVVYETNPDDLRRPRVLVVRGAGGNKLDRPRKLDLANPGDGRRTNVDHVLDADEAGVDPFDYL